MRLLSLTSKLKRYYERHPVGEALSEDTVFRFKQIRMEINEVKAKSLFLDVGCGKGSLGLFVSKGFQQYIGVDFSLNALKFAQKRRKDNMCYICATASSLPFREDVFQIILCSELLEHIPEYAKVLPECFYMLKSSGKFLITSPNRYNLNIFLSLFLTGKGRGGQEYDNPPPFPRLLRQLVENGFKVESFYCFYPCLKLSRLIPKAIAKHITGLVRSAQKISDGLLAKTKFFPLMLYIFVCVEKIK